MLFDKRVTIEERGVPRLCWLIDGVFANAILFDISIFRSAHDPQFTMDDDNDDAVQPTKETFDRVLRESYAVWSSYVDLEGSTSLPIQCIDLKGMLG